MVLPDFLTREPDGYVHLTGHRVGIRHVVELYRENFTPEMLHDHFPTIPLALIHKVIAYYLENRAAIDAYVEMSRKATDELAASSSGPSAGELRRRMEQQRESA